MKHAKPEEHAPACRGKMLRISGPGRRSHIMRKGGVLRVGRHASNDVVLSDERVSRFHCLVAWTQDASHPYVRDLGSQNGTRLDGEPVAERTLWGGEVLSLGPTRLQVELVEEPVVPALRMVALDDDDDDDDDDAQLFDESDPCVGGMIRDAAALRTVIVDLEREHRTGALHVSRDDLHARLSFAGGRVVTAHLERGGVPLDGTTAIRALLGEELEGGIYRFVLGADADAEPAPSDPVEAAIEPAEWLGLRLRDLLEPIDLPADVDVMEETERGAPPARRPSPVFTRSVGDVTLGRGSNAATPMDLPRSGAAHRAPRSA